MAGPWFAVHESGDDWQVLDDLWISDGRHDWAGRIEVRIELEGERDTI